MRLVPNLDNITECPNCANGTLVSVVNGMYRPYKKCFCCNEEIYETNPILSEQIAVSKNTMNNILNTEG